MAFDVFLSHNSKDKPAVRELAQQLNRQGIRVWLDEDQLIPGRPWQNLLEQGIEQSSTGAVLVGKDGLGPWEDEEMQALLRHAATTGKPVIPVLLPGAKSKPKLPMFLANRTWVDLRDGFTERGIAALVWGITGERAKAQHGAAAAAGPAHVSGGFAGFRRRLVLLGVVAAILAALLIYFTPGLWRHRAPPVLPVEDFTIWVITEADGRLLPERLTIPLADVAAHRTPADFVHLVRNVLAESMGSDTMIIFRLDDGETITTEQGDPLRGENRAVLVVPGPRVAEFPDPDTAFTFFSSQLPRD